MTSASLLLVSGLGLPFAATASSQPSLVNILPLERIHDHARRDRRVQAFLRAAHGNGDGVCPAALYLRADAVPLVSDDQTELFGRRENKDVFPVQIRRDERYAFERGKDVRRVPLVQSGVKHAAHACPHRLGGIGIGAAEKVYLLISRGVRRADDGTKVPGVGHAVQ